MSEIQDFEVKRFEMSKMLKAARIPWICIYDHPSDYPDKFIARLWDCNIPTHLVATADTLEELREKLPEGMARMNRSPEDDPCIVEVWI